jgi:hypothetical protein
MSDGIILASPPTGSAETAARLAGAPSWVIQAVAHERERRGLSPIAAQSAAPIRRSRRSPALPRALVGAAAPGVSSPHRIDQDGGREILPEIIAPSAWAGVRCDLLMGERFDFQTGHDGKPFARSDSPDVELHWDDVAGLMFTLRGEAAAGFRWPASGYASIGFIARKWTKRLTRRHGWVREIQAMSLRHIALLPPHHDGPAYRQARVVSVKPGEQVRAFVRLRCDCRIATKEALGR